MFVSTGLDPGDTLVRKNDWGSCSQSFQSPEGADTNPQITSTVCEIQAKVRPVNERNEFGEPLCAGLTWGHRTY